MRLPSYSPLLALAACSAPATRRPANHPGPRPAQPPALAAPPALPGTFGFGPALTQVPPFTLLDDGTLIFADEDSAAIHTVTLSRDDVSRIVRRVLELGFERLKS